MSSRPRWTAFIATAALAGLLGGLFTSAHADEQKHQISQGLYKPLSTAQKALQAKKYDDAIAALKEAEAYPRKTPFDEHVINQLGVSAYSGAGQQDQALKCVEALLADGMLSEADVPRMQKNAAILSYNMKSYDKAADYGIKVLASAPDDEDVATIVGQSYYLKKDWKSTEKFEEDWLNSRLKKGETPKSMNLELWKSACYNDNNEACLTRSLQALVTYYPKADDWEALLGELGRDPQMNDSSELQLYRLMLEVGVLKRGAEFQRAAELALERGSPGEAEEFIQKGTAAQAFNDATEQQAAQALLAKAKKRAAGDEASLPELEKEGATAATGQVDVSVGYAYLGYQQYDKAADDLGKGVAKGGLKDEAGSRLLLGIAQLKAGHKDLAIQSFQSVKGDPLLEKIANLWALHAKQPAVAS